MISRSANGGRPVPPHLGAFQGPPPADWLNHSACDPPSPCPTGPRSRIPGAAGGKRWSITIPDTNRPGFRRPRPRRN